MTPEDYKLILKCMGWNSRTWAKPLSEIFLKTGVLDKKNMNVLELGAGRVSTLSPIFLRNNNHVTITYFDPVALPNIRNRVARLSDQNNQKFTKQYLQNSILDLDKVYDVIIMKSVLGGVFRTDQALQDVNGFLKNIVANNLSEDGVLITLDNGVPFYNSLIKNFGARSAKWRYFCHLEFSEATQKSCFGLLGAFSFKTRFGKLGSVLEDITYFADRVLSGILKTHPTVIVSAYSKNHMQNNKSV